MAGLLGGSRRHHDPRTTLAVRAMGLLPDLLPVADLFTTTSDLVPMNDRERVGAALVSPTRKPVLTLQDTGKRRGLLPWTEGTMKPHAQGFRPPSPITIGEGHTEAKTTPIRMALRPSGEATGPRKGRPA